MRVVIIGGSGHVGTYLVPCLIAAGLEVINVSRAQREPYQASSAWRLVEQVTADRAAEDAGGVFGQRILALKPDIVVDLICFTLESAQQLVGTLGTHVQHFLHCGTIWVLGHSVEVPATEEAPRHPFGDSKSRNPGLFVGSGAQTRLSRDGASARPYRRTGLDPGQSHGQSRSQDFLGSSARSGGDFAEPGDGDAASRSRR